MLKDSPYRVLLRDLPVRRRFEVPDERVAEWLRGMPMRDALDEGSEAGSGRAELDLYADGTTVFVAGTFEGHLLVACSRCIGPVDVAIQEKLRVTFLPRHELPADDDDEHDREREPAGEEGAEVAGEDLDLFPYDGDVIDLEPLLREQFVLAVPFAPLCAETCKGLCSQCGIDLNTGTCSCEKPIDPRLAALKGLKLPS
jgi:uncharacterized protein